MHDGLPSSCRDRRMSGYGLLLKCPVFRVDGFAPSAPRSVVVPHPVTASSCAPAEGGWGVGKVSVVVVARDGNAARAVPRFERGPRCRTLRVLAESRHDENRSVTVLFAKVGLGAQACRKI